jgi:hypothetical protein
MQKIMFAAILSIALLTVGIVANSYHLVPSADAVKSKGKYLKDIVGKPNRDRSYSKVCGDQLCTKIQEASTSQRKGQIPQHHNDSQ